VNYSYGQETTLRIELPLLSYDVTSLSSLDNGFNDYYFNDYFIPNLRAGLIRNGLYIGVETYSSVILYYGYRSTASILAFKAESYSLLVGLEKDLYKFSARFNIGVTYNDKPIGTYVEYPVHESEIRICYGFNAFGPLVSTNLKYEIFKNLSLSLNLRVNPMLKSYRRIPNSCPVDFGDHDRVHYLVAQFAVGYDIDLKRRISKESDSIVDFDR
jgi:hypothetical protein